MEQEVEFSRWFGGDFDRLLLVYCNFFGGNMLPSKNGSRRLSLPRVWRGGFAYSLAKAGRSFRERRVAYGVKIVASRFRVGLAGAVTKARPGGMGRVATNAAVAIRSSPSAAGGRHQATNRHHIYHNP